MAASIPRLGAILRSTAWSPPAVFQGPLWSLRRLHFYSGFRTRPIDALGSTLPYCDIVVTDRAVASHARQTGLAERLGTTVLSTLLDLPALL